MGRKFGLVAVVALAGCVSTPMAPPDESQPVISLECLQRLNPSRDRPFEWCKIESVVPDTPAARQRAEEMVARVARSARRPSADELMGAETVKYRVRLRPLDDDGG